jgi:hypothetical protein
MAKLSVIARQAKTEKLVANKAAKRKALKEAGDYLALDKLPRNASAQCFSCTFEKQVQAYRSSARLFAQVRCLP